MQINALIFAATILPLLTACSDKPSTQFPDAPGHYVRIGSNSLDVLIIRRDGTRFEDTGTLTTLDRCGPVILTSDGRTALIELRGINRPSDCQLRSGTELQVVR